MTSNYINNSPQMFSINSIQPSSCFTNIFLFMKHLMKFIQKSDLLVLIASRWVEYCSDGWNTVQMGGILFRWMEYCSDGWNTFHKTHYWSIRRHSGNIKSSRNKNLKVRKSVWEGEWLYPVLRYVYTRATPVSMKPSYL